MLVSSSSSNCPLCAAAHDKALTMGGVNVNTVVGETDNFIIVPALGPLVRGHVLVISRTHSAGLRFLSAEMRQRYCDVSRQLRAYCGSAGDSLLEAEHGASAESFRGPCIRHTHIHILPGVGGAISAFSYTNEWPCEAVPQSEVANPYIWLSDGTDEALYSASSANGQEIRKTIGGYLGIDDWDWALNPKTDLIRRTVAYWSDLRSVLS